MNSIPCTYSRDECEFVAAILSSGSDGIVLSFSLAGASRYRHEINRSGRGIETLDLQLPGKPASGVIRAFESREDTTLYYAI